MLVLILIKQVAPRLCHHKYRFFGGLQGSGNFKRLGHNNFGLYKTLKTHMKLSHNMAAPVKALVSVTPKQKPRSAVSRASSIPARARASSPRPTNTSRWERNAGKLQESERPQETWHQRRYKCSPVAPISKLMFIAFLNSFCS